MSIAGLEVIARPLSAVCPRERRVAHARPIHTTTVTPTLVGACSGLAGGAGEANIAHTSPHLAFAVARAHVWTIRHVTLFTKPSNRAVALTLDTYAPVGAVVGAGVDGAVATGPSQIAVAR